MTSLTCQPECEGGRIRLATGLVTSFAPICPARPTPYVQPLALPLRCVGLRHRSDWPCKRRPLILHAGSSVSKVYTATLSSPIQRIRI